VELSDDRRSHKAVSQVVVVDSHNESATPWPTTARTWSIPSLRAGAASRFGAMRRPPSCPVVVLRPRGRTAPSWRFLQRARFRATGYLERPERRRAASLLAVDGDAQCAADVARAGIGKPTESLDENAHGHALVATRTPAIDALVDSGTIAEAQADAYREQLVDAYTFRITWDGQAATPTAEAV
jgi:hypothetical protein